MAKKNKPYQRDVEGPDAPYKKPDPARNLEGIEHLEVGKGNNSWKSDKRGMWLGSQNPEDAPFFVDMEGNITIRNGNFRFVDDEGNTTILIGF